MNRDEQITAWLDGAMSTEEARKFEAEMAMDQDLAAAVQSASATDARLRAAFPEFKVDDALIAKLGLAPKADVIDFVAARKARTERVATAPAPAQSRWQSWRLPAFSAMAAAAATLLFLNTQGDGPARPDAFQIALSTMPSGQEVALGKGQAATIRLSFRAGDGRPCREYEVSAGDTAKAGIACLSSGKWSKEAEVATKGQAAANAGGSYQTAGGDDGAALALAYDRLKASDPMSAQEEKALISRSWKK